MPTSHNAAAL